MFFASIFLNIIQLAYPKVFFRKIHRFYGENFSAQVFKNARIRRKIEFQLVRVQSLPLFAVAFVEALAPVFAVAQQRPAGVGHLDAYLVRTAGEEPALN